MKNETRNDTSGTQAAPAINPAKKREPFALRRLIERLLLILGLVLIGIYVAARIHRSVLSRVAMRQFEEVKQPTPGNPPDSAEANTAPPRPTWRTDFALWSGKRIKGFEDSLKLSVAPPLGILRIPKLHLEVPMLEGTDDLTLNRGVGRIAGTARLGEDGNIGIAGHRDGFFRGLKDIKVGDRVELEGPARTETYVVDQLEIVSPRDVSVLLPRAKPSITLVTCYPFYFIGGAPQRYIVHASRLDTDLLKDKSTEQGSLTLAK